MHKYNLNWYRYNFMLLIFRVCNPVSINTVRKELKINNILRLIGTNTNCFFQPPFC